MALIEIHVWLSVTEAECRPDVRAFVDPSPDGGFGTEREVALQPRADGWHGAFALPDDLRGAFLYRVGLVAHAGASWSYRMTHRALGQQLAADADCLPQGKCWIVGSCELPAQRDARLRAQNAAPSALALATRTTACGGGGLVRHLRLERLEPPQDGQPQDDRARHAPEKQRLFVLRKLIDQRVGPVNE
jgi:hypothetical protein